jgi:non-ribosomal peptide synthetase component F
MSVKQTHTRLPRPVPRHANLPVGSTDVLPVLAAAAWPDRVALRGGSGPVTFAELNRRISRLASGIRELIGGDGSVVVVSAVPGVEFAVAYYAVIRSGNVAAPVNPRLGVDVLDRLLHTVSARAAVLCRTMHDRARPVLAAAPRLEQVLLLDGPATEPGVPTCAELASRGDLLVEPRDRDENELATVPIDLARWRSASQSSGPVGVSHHGLKVDAARVREADGLAERSVVLHAQPAYHPTLLNAAVLAGATQVFCGSQDPAVLAREAERHGATHWYTPRFQRPAVPARKAVA